MKGAWTLSMQNESAARGACILAFDTANEVVAVGVGRVAGASVEPVACRELPAPRASNTILLNEVDATLAEAGVPKGDVAAVVCGRGPGSFTGVRICMATAKGAASALEVPLYGVSTLDAVAWRAWAEGVRGRVLVAADAMRKEVYPALFEISDSEISRLTTDAVVKAAIACEWVANQEAKLPERAGDLTILGDALVKYREIFEPLGAIADESLWGETEYHLVVIDAPHLDGVVFENHRLREGHLTVPRDCRLPVFLDRADGSTSHFFHSDSSFNCCMTASERSAYCRFFSALSR